MVQTIGVSIPHSDVACQDAFNGAPVEEGKEASRQSEPYQSVKIVKVLLRFIHHLGVCRPSLLLGDLNP